MAALSAKFRRLQAMTPVEVAYRLLTLLHDRRDHRRLKRGEFSESPADFLERQGEKATAAQLLERFRARPLFSWQRFDRNVLRAQFRRRFPEQLAATLASAQHAVERRFEIFNLTVAFDDDIDWCCDPLLKKSLPLVFSREIDYYAPAVVKEIKYVWELNRHQHFVTLAKAWYLSGDDRYAGALLEQWRDWSAKNPYLMGVNWSSALECAFRLLSWTWALQFIKSCDLFTAEFYGHILQSVERHLCYIDGHLSHFSSANNHLLGEALGLIYAGYFPELAQAKAWRDKGFSIFFDQFLNQVHEDGVGKEQSIWYHGYVLEFGVLAKLAADYAGVEPPVEFEQRLRRMAEFLSALQDNGAVPSIGDQDGGQAITLCEMTGGTLGRLLPLAATLAGATTDDDETVFWLTPNAVPKNAANDTRPLRLFRNGGYGVITRQIAGLPVKLVMDFGQLGLGKMAAHGHADALSVWLSVAGQPVLIDAGAYLYLGAGAERNYFRSARAHNTLTVDGREFAQQLGPFQWGKRPTVSFEHALDGEPICLRAGHDGYRPIRHTREIAVSADAVTIHDHVKGVGNHTIDAYFHLAPCEVRQNGRRIIGRYAAFGVEFAFEAKAPLTVFLETAAHSPRFGEKQQHPVIRLHAALPLPVVFTTHIRFSYEKN